MPEIEIRTANAGDVESLAAFDHGYYSEYVWQMNLADETETFRAEFRRVRLPRRVFVPYPRERREIFHDFEQVDALLIAVLDGRNVGYSKVEAEESSGVARVTDIVVSSPMRRQGIASGLLLAVANLVGKWEFNTLILEMQAKNDPAILMATKLGFNFCGFRDHYFSNQELALFFSRFAH